MGSDDHGSYISKFMQSVRALEGSKAFKTIYKLSMYNEKDNSGEIVITVMTVTTMTTVTTMMT